ncbi:MAG: hypothetical protein CMA70_02865 [Euryarchaeota archaeon]|nr:hypothetical protein [Euryarchaeota archaeon]
MIGRRKRCTAIRYRKRPEPHQVVPLASLKMTGIKTEESNHSNLVSHSGSLESSQSWSPMPMPENPIEISSRGWAGLHRRLLASKPVKAEVS